MTDTDNRLAELEQMGLVEKTGEYRNGKPVWIMTAYARQLHAEHPEVHDSIIERGPVDA